MFTLDDMDLTDDARQMQGTHPEFATLMPPRPRLAPTSGVITIPAGLAEDLD